jgi:hypothetical protein
LTPAPPATIFSAGITRLSARQIQLKVAMSFCANCGNQSGESAAFCASCGASLRTPPPPPPPPTIDAQITYPPPSYPPAYPPQFVPPQPIPAPSPLRYFLWIGGALLALVVLVVAVRNANHRSAPIDTTADTTTTTPAPDTAIPDAIRSVIRQDAQANIVANDGEKTLVAKIKAGGFTDDDIDAYASSINAYVTNARQIPLNDCPRDFAEAYFRHISAWSSKAVAVGAHPHVPTNDEAAADGFIRGLNGDPTGGSVQMRDEFNAWASKVKTTEAEIHDTWQEVQALTVRYNAQ